MNPLIENRVSDLEKGQKDQAGRDSALKSAIDKLTRDFEILKNTPPASPTENSTPAFFDDLQKDVAMLKSFCAHPTFWDNNANSATIKWEGLRPMEIVEKLSRMNKQNMVLLHRLRDIDAILQIQPNGSEQQGSRAQQSFFQELESQKEHLRSEIRRLRQDFGTEIRKFETQWKKDENQLKTLQNNDRQIVLNQRQQDQRIERFEEYQEREKKEILDKIKKVESKQKEQDQQIQKIQENHENEKKEIKENRMEMIRELIEKEKNEILIQLEIQRKERENQIQEMIREEMRKELEKFETQRKQDQIQIEQLQSELSKVQILTKKPQHIRNLIIGEWKMVSFSENCSEYSARNSKMWNEMRRENLKFQLNSNRFDTFFRDSNTGKWEILARKPKFQKSDFGRSRWFFENGTIRSINLNGFATVTVPWTEYCTYSIQENGRSLRIDSEMGGVKSHRIYHRI